MEKMKAEGCQGLGEEGSLWPKQLMNETTNKARFHAFTQKKGNANAYYKRYNSMALNRDQSSKQYIPLMPKDGWMDGWMDSLVDG